jgi:hypothetical protein
MKSCLLSIWFLYPLACAIADETVLMIDDGGLRIEYSFSEKELCNPSNRWAQANGGNVDCSQLIARAKSHIIATRSLADRLDLDSITFQRHRVLCISDGQQKVESVCWLQIGFTGDRRNPTRFNNKKLVALILLNGVLAEERLVRGSLDPRLK